MSYVLGVIGGSGLYDLTDLQDVTTVEIRTPFGAPSAPLIKGKVGDVELVFLPRHGKGHAIPPSAINYRANIAALKLAGATHVLSVSAVGSMKESIAPGDLVVVDQFIDLTKRRSSSFFDETGVAVHVAFSEPVCPAMAAALADAADSTGARVHRGGTYVCIEGPQFSTKAESLLYRSWGVSVIGMTNMPEAKLAREAELPFCTLALSTDYDCWHEEEGPVTADAVVEVLRKNVVNARRTILKMASMLPDPTESIAYRALDGAVMTPPEVLTDSVVSRVGWLLERHLRGRKSSSSTQ